MNLQINKKWQLITRESINGLFDITIDVGIGTGSKDMIFNQLINMLNTYGGIASAAGPMTTQIFTTENVRNILNAAWEMLGFKNAKGRFTANEQQSPIGTGIIPNGREGTQVPGTPEGLGVPGTSVRSQAVYPEQMAAMPY